MMNRDYQYFADSFQECVAEVKVSVIQNSNNYKFEAFDSRTVN